MHKLLFGKEKLKKSVFFAFNLPELGKRLEDVQLWIGDREEGQCKRNRTTDHGLAVSDQVAEHAQRHLQKSMSLKNTNIF